MTDQTIPADKVREILDEWERIKEYADWDDLDALVKDIRALLPPPPRPTLADMTEEERAECRWMQADAGPYGRRGLIVKVKYWSVYVVDQETGTYSDYTPDLVTARPDLPRMEWNGTDQEDVAPDHLAVGTVIESADDPRIAALPDGTILLDRNEEATTKRPRPWGWTGLGNTPAEDEGDEPGPWTVLHIPKESDQ